MNEKEEKLISRRKSTKTNIQRTQKGKVNMIENNNFKVDFKQKELIATSGLQNGNRPQQIKMRAYFLFQCFLIAEKCWWSLGAAGLAGNDQLWERVWLEKRPATEAIEWEKKEEPGCVRADHSDRGSAVAMTLDGFSLPMPITYAVKHRAR